MKKLDIGKRINQLRESRGWSLNALGERAGMSHSHVSKLERGESSPTIDVLERLAEAFGLSLPRLIVGEIPRDNDEVLIKYNALSPKDRLAVDRLLELYYRDAQDEDFLQVNDLALIA